VTAPEPPSATAATAKPKRSRTRRAAETAVKRQFLLPWEQQDGETAIAFEAFAIYRDMGAERSLRKVAATRDSEATRIYAWATEWSWAARVTAYDRDQDRQWRAAQDKQRKDMAIRHAAMAGAALSKVAARLAALNPDDLSPSELIRWLEVAVKVERQARGEPDQKIEVGGSIRDSVAELSPTERREALLAAQREVGARLLNPELLALGPVQSSRN
jgi:hypothetical protein